MQNKVKLKEEQKLFTLSDIIGKPLTADGLKKRLEPHPDAWATLQGLKEEYRRQLMDFLLGESGLSITYDCFFKKIMNPWTNRERMEAFLSAILKMKVKICKVLPTESTKLIESGGNVIMDIMVELEDGRTVDVEIQKVGYKFPGERCDCYISDLIMRQYNYGKSKEGQFSYRDMNPVILIVIMEKSPSEFHAAAPHYIHRGTRIFDTGVKVKSLSEIVLVSLDIFHDIVQTVDTDLEAWLAFLSSDNPDRIVELVNKYPEFLQYYREIAEFRTKPEELITMYSEALLKMDHNNTIYTLTEYYKEQLADRDAELAVKDSEIADKNAELAEKEAENMRLKRLLEDVNG